MSGSATAGCCSCGVIRARLRRWCLTPTTGRSPCSKGTCGRGIYDNMKTAVETIFVGKGRLYNRRFMQMCSHYLVDPVACTPASGWEKGQVENQVGLVRERFFTPRLRFKTLDELNAWLLDKCIAYAKAHRHPELTEQTVWEVFEAERPKLVPYAGRFDGFHAVPASVSKTCLVRFDIINAVLTDGLPAVEAACVEAIAHGVHSADVVLNILARQRDPAPPANIVTPAALTLRHAPIADCARYDNLRRTI